MNYQVCVYIIYDKVRFHVILYYSRRCIYIFIQQLGNAKSPKVESFT